MLMIRPESTVDKQVKIFFVFVDFKFNSSYSILNYNDLLSAIIIPGMKSNQIALSGRPRWLTGIDWSLYIILAGDTSRRSGMKHEEQANTSHPGSVGTS